MKAALIPRPKILKESGRIFPKSGLGEPEVEMAALRGPESYALQLSRGRTRIQAGGQAGLFYARQTLAQLLGQCEGEVPELEIEDWPDFKVRGLSYDMSRGRVPKLERLFEMIDLLAGFKVNQLQLYTEHTFQFRNHPLIGEGCSPLSAEEMRRLDRHCRERHIELVPSLASFGHMSRLLSLPPYRHLAEDLGAGLYSKPGVDKKKAGLEWMPEGWTLSPGKEEGYAFLGELYEEYLPLFSSGQFNACCDEPFDLGWGQSAGACLSRGLGAVYVDHVLRLHEMAARHGKRLMIWADVIRHHPQDLKRLPADVVVLDWKYDPWDDFKSIQALKAPGRGLYACPATGSWGSLFPRLHYAGEGMAGFAQAGAEAGAEGLLNTEWGDGGHFNFTENSWHGFALGAELGWNTATDLEAFTPRFCRAFLNCPDPSLAQALNLLGDHAALSRGRPERFWTEAFFAGAEDPLFHEAQQASALSLHRRVRRDPLPIGPAFAAATRRDLEWIIHIFRGTRNQPGQDPHGVLPYWTFAAEGLLAAVERFQDLGAQRRDALASHAERMARLRARFEELWHARNRPSEIAVTLERYDRVILSLRGTPVAR